MERRHDRIFKKSILKLKKNYLSICIPTNGRIEILKKTLDSIFLVNPSYYEYFEVVITDNSQNSDVENQLENYHKFINFKYFKSTANGFMNILEALNNGTGQLLKLHNNYTKIDNPSSLISLIECVKVNEKNKPLIFFTNGNLKNCYTKLYSNYDKFIYDLSFWNTWAMGFSIWKEDFDKYKNSDLNPMFPHTSLLLYHENSNKCYLINNKIYFINQVVSNKGGYDLFKTFCVDYLGMIKMSLIKNKISKKTFNKIKRDLYFKFLIQWYYNTKRVKNDFTFVNVNIKKSITVFYSPIHYYMLVLFSITYPFVNKIISLNSRIFKSQHLQ